MKKLGLKSRMILPINGVILIVLGLLIFLQARHASQSARTAAVDRAQEMAHRYASDLESQLDDAMTTTRLVAQSFEGMKSAWVDDRNLLNGTLSQILKANTNLVALWTCWEPDALDAKDASFAGKSGYDQTGRFIPLWYRADSGVTLDKLADYAKEDSFYLQTKKGERDTLFEPTRQKLGPQEAFVATVTAPVRYNGELIAVVGAHVAMSNLQFIVASIHPYGSGYASLVAPSGRYVAHADKEKIGQQLNLTEAQAALASGHVYTRTTYSPALQTDLYEVFVPLQVGESKAPWSLAVSLPMNKILAEANRAMLESILVGVGALLFVAIIVTWLARSLSRPLNRLASHLNEATELVNETSEQMHVSSRSLAEHASHQAASLEETSAALEQMAAMTRGNADSASQAYELAKQVREAADHSVVDMHEMDQATAAIKVSSNNIAKIIKTIDEIAFQTNILSLNAAVEAARAGEAGLGFAVVAEEVRRLAQRSAEAAKETAQKIEESIARTDRGVQVSTQVGEALQNIVEKVRQMDQLVASIAQASKEQSQGIDQMNIAMTQMDKFTQSNAADAQESADCSDKLKSQAAALKEAVHHLSCLISGASDQGVARPALSVGITDGQSTKLPSSPAQLALGSQSRAKVNGGANGARARREDFPMP